MLAERRDDVGLTAHAVRDLAGSMLGRQPHLIPIVGPPGSLAAITSADAEVGYQAIMGPTFRNEMHARGILPILLNRPVSVASRLTMPILLVVAEQDSIAPVSAVEAVADKAGGGSEVLRLPVGHFEIYLGEPFERSVEAQVTFLKGL